MVNGHTIPDLGLAGRTVHVTPGLAALPRKLGEAGTFDAKAATGPNGEILPMVGRAQLVDAEELVGMFREAMREELRRFARVHGLPVQALAELDEIVKAREAAPDA